MANKTKIKQKNRRDNGIKIYQKKSCNPVKTKQKLYTVREIAEMLDVNDWTVRQEIRVAKIKPAGFKRVAKVYRKVMVFNIAAVNKIRKRRMLVDRRCVRSGVAADAANGRHDAEGTELLRAVDKYKLENRIQMMKVSDWLAVFKSLGYRKAESA